MISEAAPIFAESEAQSFRIAHIITGNESGDFLLFVTYSSMAVFETSYYAIGKSYAIAKGPVAEKIYGFMAVNVRMIAKIQGVA